MAATGWVFPLRRSATYKPYRPKDSFTRTGYAKTKTNPRGYHWATDYTAPVRTIVQAPEKCRVVWKGRYGDLGLVIEVLILSGRGKGLYWRCCHLKSYTSKEVGATIAKGEAIGRVGLTGNTSGPHLHGELGKSKLKSARDPRYNPASASQEAYDSKRWRAI